MNNFPHSSWHANRMEMLMAIAGRAKREAGDILKDVQQPRAAAEYKVLQSYRNAYMEMGDEVSGSVTDSYVADTTKAIQANWVKEGVSIAMDAATGESTRANLIGHFEHFLDQSLSIGGVSIPGGHGYAISALAGLSQYGRGVGSSKPIV